MRCSFGFARDRGMGRERDLRDTRLHRNRKASTRRWRGPAPHATLRRPSQAPTMRARVLLLGRWATVTGCVFFVHATTLAGQATPRSAATQQASRAPTTAFAAEDALDVVTAAVGDLTDDGRWLALTSSVRRDAYGQDYRRDGDPTYVRGTPTRLLVIDTKSGVSQSVFPDKRPVRAPRWSPDGKRLAMLLFNGDVYEPAVWDRASGKLTVGHLPAGKYVAETSDIRWASDGSSLVFAVHT